KIGEGITGRAAATGEPQLVPNTLECDYAVMIPGTHTIEESLVAVPLCYGARVIGVVVISKLGVDQFDEDDVRLLQVLAGHASVALTNARLYEAQRREADHLKALLEFTGAISQASTLEAIGVQTVRAASRMLGGKRSALWLRGPDGRFRIAAHSDYDADERLRLLLDISLGYEEAERLVGARTAPFTITAEQGVAMDLPFPAAVEWRDMAIAPLRPEHALEGWLVVRDLGEDGVHSTEELLRLLSGLSHQAGVALERARSFESLEGTFVSTVEALANALEANDEETSSHTRWITDMALRVGTRMGFDGPAL